jgi:hypothetical protein
MYEFDPDPTGMIDDDCTYIRFGEMIVGSYLQYPDRVVTKQRGRSWYGDVPDPGGGDLCFLIKTHNAYERRADDDEHRKIFKSCLIMISYEMVVIRE